MSERSFAQVLQQYVVACLEEWQASHSTPRSGEANMDLKTAIQEYLATRLDTTRSESDYQQGQVDAFHEISRVVSTLAAFEADMAAAVELNAVEHKERA